MYSSVLCSLYKCCEVPTMLDENKCIFILLLNYGNEDHYQQ